MKIEPSLALEIHDPKDQRSFAEFCIYMNAPIFIGSDEEELMLDLIEKAPEKWRQRLYEVLNQNILQSPLPPSDQFPQVP